MEPLQMPPMVLYTGKVPAFLLAWRRGAASWEGRLAIPQTQVDVRGEQVHGVKYLWAPTTDVNNLPGVDYAAVPRPAPGEEEPEPLRMPPMVLYSGRPAFLLAWTSFEADGRQGWRAGLFVPPAAGEPPQPTQLQVGAGSVTRLPEVDYDGVPRQGQQARVSP